MSSVSYKARKAKYMYCHVNISDTCAWNESLSCVNTALGVLTEVAFFFLYSAIGIFTVVHIRIYYCCSVLNFVRQKPVDVENSDV